MYSCKYVLEFLVLVLVIDSINCDMNEPRCYSRFDYEEKMLEKMVRSEIKNEELLAQLGMLEKRLTNVETEVNNSVKEIKGLEKEHETEKEEQKKYDQRLDAISRNITESVHQSPVAFFATLTSSSTTSSSHQTLVFNNVVTDVGGGYNPGTGVFTAPVNGLYVFSASVMVDLSTSATFARIRIIKNGSHVVYLYVNDSDGDHETVAGTVILSLQIGDTVKLTCNESGRVIHNFSFISGFRL